MKKLTAIKKNKKGKDTSKDKETQMQPLFHQNTFFLDIRKDKRRDNTKRKNVYCLRYTFLWGSDITTHYNYLVILHFCCT